VDNPEEATKCAACEVPKPGAAPEKIEAKADDDGAASGGFVFGISSDTDITTAAPETGFVFGQTANAATDSDAVEFKFGV
jgi:hypothetical protein